jgi:hypothetical protein
MTQVVRRLLLCGLVGTVWATPGCSRQGSSYRHELVTGTLESLDAATGQLVLRMNVPGTDDERKLTCLLTNDAEVYVNDVFSGWDALRPGDAAELIGFTDPEPPHERFIVALAHVARALPPVPEPDLTPASSTKPAQEK